MFCACVLSGKTIAVKLDSRVRGQQPRHTDDQWHKYSLALAPVAAAQSTPARHSTLLAEAQAAPDSLPAEVRGVRSSKMAQGLIADSRRP